MAEPPPAAAPPDALLLQLDGFEGPLDLLLELARAQKLDLARISILALVEQFLAVVEGARRVRLELAADWLVMAAWLAWLKSRLLLPRGSEAAEEGEAAAEVLAARLLDLQAMRAAVLWLGQRPQLGHEVFARGEPEDFTVTDRSRLALDVGGLLRAYLAGLRRAAGTRQYRPAPMNLWGVQDALARLEGLMGSLPDWAILERFLPESLTGPLERRAALASTLLAGLEMARGGALRLRQESAFGPILVRRVEDGEEHEHE
ncbi:MAG: segregation/condensation protein A [Rhodospirillales bacterium]|nr:segregation/condensation protein A [Rhodospirillales bacterium]MDE2577108.1 segregation/condensation protein A [Rhodospirillales bacterium]